MGQAWVKVVCAASDDPEMVKTQFVPVEIGNEHICWVVAESLALTMPEMRVTVGLCPSGWSLPVVHAPFIRWVGL